MTTKTDKIATDATLPDVTAKEADAAKKEGVLEAIKDDAGQRFRSTDGIATDDGGVGGITPTYDVFQIADMVDMEPDALKATLAERPLGDGRVAGLLEAERSGKNRTDIVKVLCDYLGIKTPYEVTDAGPAYTNDVSRSVVKPRG